MNQNEQCECDMCSLGTNVSNTKLKLKGYRI